MISMLVHRWWRADITNLLTGLDSESSSSPRGLAYTAMSYIWFVPGPWGCRRWVSVIRSWILIPPIILGLIVLSCPLLLNPCVRISWCSLLNTKFVEIESQFYRKIAEVFGKGNVSFERLNWYHFSRVPPDEQELEPREETNRKCQCSYIF